MRDLYSGQRILIISPRESSKTSLITAVIGEIHKQHVLVAYFDRLRTTTGSASSADFIPA